MFAQGQTRVRRNYLAAALAGGLWLLMSAAFGQNAVPSPPQAPAAQLAPEAAPALAPPAPNRRPGLFEAIGRWFDERSAAVREHMRGAKERIDTLGNDAAQNSRDLGGTAANVSRNAVEVTKDAVEATRGAVDAVTKLPSTRIMQGHERCAMAPNGAPDCLTAAQALCRKHGYATGKSMDFTSAEECPPRAYLSGRQSQAECTTVTFISRAMCQ